MSLFSRARLEKSSLCMAITGGPGTGKTYTSLKVGTHLGERICLIDAEHGRASLYAREFEFDTAVLPNFHPRTYVHYLKAAMAEEYDVIIIDGITPEWDGQGGCLHQVDDIQRRGGNKASAWSQITPLHDDFIRAVMDCNTHLICTVRGRERYAIDTDNEGRNRVVKLGLGPIQQDKVSFEFPIIGTMDSQHNLQIVKTVCHSLKGAVMFEPGEDLARILSEWLEGDSYHDRTAYLGDEQVNAAMSAAVRTNRWTMNQITALIRSYSADSVATLGAESRRKLVNALTASTGGEWVTYNLKAQGARHRAS
ncbi:MAG: AAA family ATPase [Myxococcota bacterium]|nr:AAA family ATPase [Myxococcota bacterium]